MKWLVEYEYSVVSHNSRELMWHRKCIVSVHQVKTNMTPVTYQITDITHTAFRCLPEIRVSPSWFDRCERFRVSSVYNYRMLMLQGYYPIDMSFIPITEVLKQVRTSCDVNCRTLSCVIHLSYTKIENWPIFIYVKECIVQESCMTEQIKVLYMQVEIYS